MEDIAESIDAPRSAVLVRAAVIGLVLIAAMLAIHLTPVRAWLDDVQSLRATVKDLGSWAYPLSVIAIAGLIACGVPRLLLCAAGGMLFGFWTGLLITQIGTMLGHYAVFLFMRWGGRDRALARWPKLSHWTGVVQSQGIVGVILLRQVPIHAMLINLALGMSNLKHREFLIGTAIGLLPHAIPATLVGAGLMKASLEDSAGYVAVASIVFVLIWILCRDLVRGYQARPEIRA